MNTIEKWLGEDNKLGIDIWNKKYRYNGESFNEWLDRVCKGNDDIRQLILDKKFLFGGRILASRGLQNKGRKITFSNCYVITPPDDNIESIFDCAKKLARTYSYGGGCGLDISNLAPSGAKINNAAKETTGAVSFMNLYSMVTELIGQFGRRGALMLSMDCSHPDIEQFIDIKNDLTKVTKANISVKITDYFMDCLKTGKPWKLHFSRPETNELIERDTDPSKIWERLCENNWNMAEPGILFWDRIKNWNLLSEDEEFEYAGVNPCAEEPLPAGGSCLLGSINLCRFVKKPFTQKAQFDFDDFSTTVKKTVVALNEVLDEGLPLHPLEEQKESVKNWRQIGLGIMGLGDMLIMLGIRYGNSDAVSISEKIAHAMINSAVEQSAMLAKDFGAYPKYKKEAVFASPFFNKNITDEVKKLVDQYGLRNSQLLTCAPTGTLSTMLGISGGIEPIYASSYQRKTESLHGEDVYYTIYTPIVEQYMSVNNIDKNEKLPDYVVTSMELDYTERIDMQSAWQNCIDASISSTVNVPNEFSVDDVKKLYIKAWENGLKGVTIYRDGCARTGILTTEKTEKSSNGYKLDHIQPVSRRSLGETVGTTNKYVNACGSFYLTINRDKDNNIVETFINTSKTGTCESNIAGLNRMISLSLRTGTKIEEIVDQLKGIKCSACTVVKSKGEKSLSGMSCPDIIAKAIAREYYKNNPDKVGKPDVQESGDNVCPECKTKLNLMEGCATCPNCGFSKCN